MFTSPISRNMKNFSGVALGVLCFSIGVGGFMGSAWALETGGVTYFENVPVLTRAYANNVSSTYSYARYYFEVTIPQNSGEPLGGLAITIPLEITIPSSESIRVTDSTDKPIAFQMELQQRTVQLTFSPPVSSGEKITVQLYPMSNPHTGGNALFGISALPPGKQPHAQFLGFGRLSFIQGGRR
jgi:hypothetical protein